MKILLIIPRYSLTNKKDYQYVFPLGMGYISSTLKKSGYPVDIINFNHLNGKTEDLIKKQLDKINYDIVMTGHISMGYAITEKIIQAVKNHFSKPKFILGGSLITSEPELIFNALNPDFAVLGEGEITILELLKELQKPKPELKNIDGIIFRQNNQLIKTKCREQIMNLDLIPTPDFDGLSFAEKLDNEANNFNIYNLFDFPRTYPILTSRGCAYNCTFCYHTLGRKYRTRSIDNVMDELEFAVKKYRINILEIIDDLFSVNKERLYEFCKRLKKFVNSLSWECKWECQLAVNTIDKEMLRTLKNSGCHAISYGFESYSQEVLKSMKKPITPEQIDNAIKLTIESGLSIQGNFIFGDINETKKTAEETLDYWKKNCNGQVKLGFIQPYPGSEIYNHSVKKGIIKDRLDFIKNKVSHTNWFNMTNSMTDKEIEQLKKDILEARRKYIPYAIHKKIRKTNKPDYYNITAKCPYCRHIVEYKNCFIENPIHYNMHVSCRNCRLRFFIVSRLYKIGNDYYNQLDFLRRNYLLVRDNFLKKKI